MTPTAMLGQQIVGLVEITFVITGLILFGRHVVSTKGRNAAAAARTRADTSLRWSITSTDFLLFLFCVITGGLLGSTLCVPLFGLFGVNISPDADHTAATLLIGGAFHAGMLAGVAFFRLALRREEKRQTSIRRPGWMCSLATLFIALPLVSATAIIWQSLLRLCGLEIHEQDIVGLFSETDAPLLLGGMALLAVVSAPVTEELVFRAGIFRFLRTRAPRWVSLAVPALLFAAMHANLASFAPLAVLGLVFALAYERSGTIAVPILAHALFNLNTIIMLLVGLGGE